MTEYVFAPTTLVQSVDWDDPSVWSGGVVPTTADADVVLPEIFQTASDPEPGYDVPYFMTLSSAQSYAIDTLTITDNDLTLMSTLAVAGSVTLQSGSEIDLAGATLSFGGLQNDGYDIQGYGNLVSAGAIANAGNIVGSGLTIAVGSLQNSGSLTAAGGGLTVHAEGAGGSLLDGTLTGGTYEASGGTLGLDMGGLIVGDDATVDLGSLDGLGGTNVIDSVDPASGQTLSLQQTLQQIDGDGSLNLVGQDYESTSQLTVAGNLTVSSGASFSAPQLNVVSSGSVSGNGTLTGPIIDDGTITASSLNVSAGTLDVQGPVSGTGTLVVAPDPSLTSNLSIFYEPEPSTLELGASVSVNVSFADSTGILILDDPQNFTGTITPAAPQYVAAGRLAPGAAPPSAADTIQLTGIAFDTVTGESYAGDASGGVLTIVAAGGTQTLRFAGDYTTASFVLSAGPQAVSSAPPSLDIIVTPIPAAPTIGLALDGGGSAAVAIVNTGTPTVTGAVAAGATVSLTADGAGAGSPLPTGNPGDTTGTYKAALTTALAPGMHQVDAVATNQAGTAAATGVLSLFVLPDPVNGISTASVGSAQIASLLDQGARMQFISGTEAIRLTDGTLSVGTDTDQALVQRLYEGLLGRGGDTTGLVGFTSLVGTAGGAAVATAMLNSPEFQHLHGAPGSMSDTGFVTLLYQGLLGRAPDAPGLASHVQALQNGTSFGAVAAGIAGSPEAKSHLAADTTNVWVPDASGALVTELYETAFARAPDPAGLAGFSQALHAGQTPQQIAQSIASSPEFLADHAGQDPTALVTSLYANGLGRAPDPAGLQHNVAALQSGATTGSILLGIAASPEAYGHLIRPV